MVDFLYQGHYEVYSQVRDEPERGHEPAGVDEIVAHVRCHTVAEAYQIPAMSNAALESFKGLLLVSHPSDVANTVELIAGSCTSDAIKSALRDVASERIQQLAKCSYFLDKLATSTVPTVDGLVVFLLEAAVLQHEATIDRSQKLEKTIRLHEETIRVEKARVAHLVEINDEVKESANRAHGMLAKQSAEAVKAETALQEAQEAAREAKETTAQLRVRAETAESLHEAWEVAQQTSESIEQERVRADDAEASLARARAEARALHAQAAQVQRLVPEKDAACAELQRKQEELDAAQRANDELTTQVQRAQEYARVVTTASSNKADKTELLSTQRRCARHEQLAEDRRRRWERFFHMMNKIRYCHNCDEEFSAKLQKPVGESTTPIVDLELTVRCLECGYLHEVDDVL